MRNLNTLLNSRCQSEKAIAAVVMARWHSGKGKTRETVKVSVVVKGQLQEGTVRAQRIFKALKLLCLIL